MTLNIKYCISSMRNIPTPTLCSSWRTFTSFLSTAHIIHDHSTTDFAFKLQTTIQIAYLSNVSRFILLCLRDRYPRSATWKAARAPIGPFIAVSVLKHYNAVECLMFEILAFKSEFRNRNDYFSWWREIYVSLPLNRVVVHASFYWSKI